MKEFTPDRRPLIVAPNEGRPVDFPGHAMKVLLDGATTTGNVAFVELTVAPQSFGAPPHIHHDEDEYFYVLEGEVRILSENQVFAAQAGTFAAMTRGYLHAFWNASNTPARMLVAIAPGTFGGFFDDVVTQLRKSGAETAAEVAATIAEVAKKRNAEVYPDRVPDEAKSFLPR
jgi:quercetin dioxygenase-like cupin family protein